MKFMKQKREEASTVPALPSRLYLEIRPKNEVVSLSSQKHYHSSKEGEMPSAGGIRKDITGDKGLEIRYLKLQHN